MRIGIIIEHYDPNAGGAERWAAGFAQYLLNAGHEVHIFTFKCDLDIAPLILHLMPEPGTLIGRAEIVEKCVAPFRPMVLQDYGTGWSADVFHPQTGSRLLCVKQDLAAQANKGIAASFSLRTLWRHHLMDQDRAACDAECQEDRRTLVAAANAPIRAASFAGGAGETGSKWHRFHTIYPGKAVTFARTISYGTWAGRTALSAPWPPIIYG